MAKDKFIYDNPTEALWVLERVKNAFNKITLKNIESIVLKEKTVKNPKEKEKLLSEKEIQMKNLKSMEKAYKKLKEEILEQLIESFNNGTYKPARVNEPRI